MKLFYFLSKNISRKFSKKYLPVRGTHDIFSNDLEIFNHIKDVCFKVSKNYLFSEIQTPIFENTDLFKRSLGEDSDVLRKEMYTFNSNTLNNESISLRPEGFL
jgi:histidyl-tRNA synthetase